MKKLLSFLLAAVVVLGMFSGCTADNDKTIVVAASETPHAEILRVVKPILERQGYTLEIRIYDDYVNPNLDTQNGKVDANYFQHKPHMDAFNAQNGNHLSSEGLVGLGVHHLISVAAIHYEPMAIYAGTKSSLSSLDGGDSIVIPNDPTNRTRALLLLEAKGIILLKDDCGPEITLEDIESYITPLDIIEMDASKIANARSISSLCVMNGNVAMQAGLLINENYLGMEDGSEAAETYANILCVRWGSDNRPKIKALIEALTSDTVKYYIRNNYRGLITCAFDA